MNPRNSKGSEAMFGSVIRACKRTMTTALVTTLALTASLPVLPPSKGEAAAATVPRVLSAPEELGTMVTAPSTLHSAYGVEDGVNVMYTTVTGSAVHSAIFSVINLDDYGVIREIPLSGGGQSWGHVLDSQKNVYTVSGGYLYKYSPVTKKVATIGAVPGSSTLYNISVDENDVIYGGAYPTGKVFQYNPATNTITNYEPPLYEGADYAKTTAYYKGHLYAGSGSVGKLFKLDPATGGRTEIPLPDSPLINPTGKPTMVYTMNAVGDYLFILMSTTPNILIIYDLEREEWVDHIVENYRGMYVSPEQGGKVYFPADGEFHTFDLMTREIKPTGLAFGTYLRNSAWVELKDQANYPGKSLVTVMFAGQVVVANFTTRTVTSLPSIVSGTPISIQSLAFGPDQMLYSTGYQGTKGARYNIETGEKELFSMGQAEGLITFGDKVIFGEYPAAVMHELDPSQDLQLGVNPRKIHQIGDSQDRPFTMTAGGGKLFIGTIPKLGILGGSLTVYDGHTWESFLHTDIVPNQSIMGLAYREVNGRKLLYGSTTVWGGLNVDPVEPEAKLFVWDVESKSMLKVFTPDIHQSNGVKPRAIGGLAFGPDGLLWGAAYGTLFAIDPDTYQTVKQKEIVPTDWVFGHYWVPVKLEWDAAGDGVLYTTLGSKIVAVDTRTMTHYTVPGTKSNLMDVGPDGNIYFSEADMLKKITVSKDTPVVYENVDHPLWNNGFEQRNADGTIPGWEALGAPSETATYEVSAERSNGGRNSLKIVDTSDRQEAGVVSLPFPVKPGVEYTGKADLFLESGRTIVSMKYYDAEGREIRVSPAPAVYHTSPTGAWKTVEFSSLAPGNAATARMALFCSTAWATVAYYDNVRVQSLVPSEAAPTGPFMQKFAVTNPGFEQVRDDGTIVGWTKRTPDKYNDKEFVALGHTASEGSNSLYLYDNHTSRDVPPSTVQPAVDSDLIPIIGGRTYTVKVDAYRSDIPAGRTSNAPVLQIRYFDANRKELSTSASPGPWSITVDTPMKQWDAASLTNTSPANASYIRVTLISSATGVANYYFDNVSVATQVAAEDYAYLKLRSAPVSHAAEGSAITFQAAAPSGAQIVVTENGNQVSEAAGEGEDQPVNITISAPAAGTRSYSVYAVVKGFVKSSVVELPAVEVHPLSELMLYEPALTLEEGETRTVQAKAVYGPVVQDVTPVLTTQSGILEISGAAIRAMNAGQAVVNVTYGAIARTLPVTVTGYNLSGILLSLPGAKMEVGEQATAEVLGVYSNGKPDQDRLLPLTEGVALSAQPAGIVAVDGLNVTGVAAGRTVLQAVYGGFTAAVPLEVAAKPVDPVDPIELSVIRDRLTAYEASGQLRKPLTNQLNNSLDQAEKHWEKGKTQQAVKSLEDFLKHLDNKAHQDKISPAGKAQLTEDVRSLIGLWLRS